MESSEGGQIAFGGKGMRRLDLVCCIIIVFYETGALIITADTPNASVCIVHP